MTYMERMSSVTDVASMVTEICKIVRDADAEVAELRAKVGQVEHNHRKEVMTYHTRFAPQIDAVRNIPYAVAYCLTGSRIVCYPPSTNSDLDIVVYVTTKQWKCKKTLWGDHYEVVDVSDREKGQEENSIPTPVETLEYINACGWKYDKEKSNTYGSLSIKKFIHGIETNVIIVTSFDEFNSWVRATGVAKALNLTRKEDRILLFDHMQSWKNDKAPALSVDLGYFRTAPQTDVKIAE